MNEVTYEKRITEPDMYFHPPIQDDRNIDSPTEQDKKRHEEEEDDEDDEEEADLDEKIGEDEIPADDNYREGQRVKE